MPISKTSLLLPGLACLLATPMLEADVASFSGEGSKLSGTLQSINAEGIIEWNSPFAETPLKLRTDKLQQVEFPESAQEVAPAPVMITLRNGDELPALAIHQWGEGGLATETSIAGAVTIPRDVLASAQYGIRSENIIYSGPQNLREWTTGRGEPGNWTLRGKSLVSSGQSVAAHDFKLPENFSLRFGLEWQTRSPNFSCTFADPLAMGSTNQDYYRFNFDSSGIRIVRHVKDKSPYRTLAQWQRRPSQFPGKMEVEIRVNRSKRQLELLIDGESEGLVVDPIETLPKSSGVSFSCVTQSDGTQAISNIRLVELNGTRARHLAEDRGDATRDSLITADDDRWSGKLISIINNEKGRHLVFKPTFSQEPWEVPENEISTLFFADPKPSEGGAKAPDGRFVLEFHGSGELTVTDCVIEGDLVQATHPLIGALQIQRQSVRLIRRIK